MSTRALLTGALVVVVLLVASPALATGGGWDFRQLTTLDYTGMGWGPPYDDVDGRIYQSDGTTLVNDGALVQVVIGLDGADIVDPLEHFDSDHSGAIQGAELDALAAWVQAGADPADISGGTNVLAYGSLGFTGEFATSGGAVNWVAPPGSEPIIYNGFAQDKLAWRAWNLTKDELAKWCDLQDHPEMLGVELWYTDGREYFTHGNEGGGPDTGWWIGMPALQPDDPLYMWIGFSAPIGAEVYAYYVSGETTARSQNRLDHYLGVCIPEPGTMLLVASGLLLLVARRARRRARSKAGSVMAERMLCAAVLVAALLISSSALATGGGWSFNELTTLNYTMYPYPYSQVDGRIYMPDGTTLVPEGSLVQIIIGLDGADIVDPLEHFDYDHSGAIQGAELGALAAWVQAGADPADISGGTNVLAYGGLDFTGEFATSGGELDWIPPAGAEPVIENGFVQDKLAWRAWNLTKGELAEWCDLENHPEMLGVELWYTDGREYFTHENEGGGPDTGWWIGMPMLQPDDPPGVWTGFVSPIGAEVYRHYVDGIAEARSQNRLDHYLGVCVPEPGTMLLVASGLLLLVVRRARKPSRGSG